MNSRASKSLEREFYVFPNQRQGMNRNNKIYGALMKVLCLVF